MRKNLVLRQFSLGELMDLSNKMQCDNCANDVEIGIYATVYGEDVIVCNVECLGRLFNVWKPRKRKMNLPVDMIVLAASAVAFVLACVI